MKQLILGAYIIILILVGVSSVSSVAHAFDVLGVASINFSDGRTGTITYNELTNSTTMQLSDGTTARTSHNDLTNNSTTQFSNGITATSHHNDLTNNIYTSYSSGLTSTTHYNDLTDTLYTTFSDGSTATTTYNDLTRTATTSVFGIFLLPSMKNILFNPQANKLKTIRNQSERPSTKDHKEGWIRSSPSKTKLVPHGEP